MAADPDHLDALRKVFEGHPAISEKNMFGGTFFMLSGNMLCGIGKYGYMFRVGPELEDEALTRPGAARVDMSRPMPGFVHVEPEAAIEHGLEDWVALSTKYVDAMPPKT